jgi:hypothetical protein
MKLLQTLRLDRSDTYVFDRAAAPGEWAISGAFLFAEAPIENLTGARRAAFRSGFLGIDSFGWSTLVQIVETDAIGRDAAVALLARKLVEHCGAPSAAAARDAAAEEIAFAASLCDHPLETVVAVHRRVEDGEIREAYRSLHRRDVTELGPVFSFTAENDEHREPSAAIDIRKLANEPS